MQITVRIKDTPTVFMGKKEEILPKIQKFLYDNRHLDITVQNDGKEKITYGELFLDHGKNNRVQKEKKKTTD